MFNDLCVRVLLKLSEDSVPNIKFNVSKCMEEVNSKLTPANRDKCREKLRVMEKEEVD
jgi:hypothetical protein